MCGDTRFCMEMYIMTSAEYHFNLKKTLCDKCQNGFRLENTLHTKYRGAPSLKKCNSQRISRYLLFRKHTIKDVTNEISICDSH